MQIEFIKMTAQGNDYVYIDRRQINLSDNDVKDLVVRLSDRHFGIGSDGVVFLQHSEEADLEMEMYNSNGSRGKMCGSALRSLIYLLSKEKNRNDFVISTDSGLRKGWLVSEDGSVKVEMGSVIEYEQIEDEEEFIYLVNIGNRHIVKIYDDISELDIPSEIAKREELLEEKEVNHEFVEISGGDCITMKVYEYGSGLTLACGTGAVASAYTCRQEGMVAGDEVTVNMPGGEVLVSFDSEEIYLTGLVKIVFRGIIEV